ncbi:hypothetical protein [Kitasatospora griseola]|uniref:hypothetical protein n=1 Tax=Kitasatospora griseola TaxID=2064 RepID=UPI0038280169
MGDEYRADEQGPSVVVRHHSAEGPGCDEPVALVLQCAAGHTDLPPAAVHRAPGPGAHHGELGLAATVGPNGLA